MLELFDNTVFQGRARPDRLHMVKVLILVLDRISNKELMSTETEILFIDDRAYIGGQDKTNHYETGTICYFSKQRALNYLTDTHHTKDDLCETVREFREKTQGKTWCFDAVVMETTELNVDEYLKHQQLKKC